MFKVIAVTCAAGLLLLPLVALSQEECCPVRNHSLSLGGWVFHDDAYIGLSYGVTEATNITVFLGPAMPLVLYGRLDYLLKRSCFFEVRAIGLGGIPLSSNINWQKFGFGVSLELCIPQLEQLSFDLAGGFYFYHYSWCGWSEECFWDWKSGFFLLFGFKVYVK